MDNATLDVDKALPLGLATNELLLNAFKHGCSNSAHPEVELTLIRNNGSLHLQVKDNGEGLPQSFSLDSRSSFGMKLVQLMCKQIGASFSWHNKNGACFDIELINIK